jgi:hypothetical protein
LEHGSELVVPDYGLLCEAFQRLSGYGGLGFGVERWKDFTDGTGMERMQTSYSDSLYHRVAATGKRH